MHWARVMLGSREVAMGLLRLVNALTGVGTLRPPFSDQNTQVRGQIAELATAVFNTLPVVEVPNINSDISNESVFVVFSIHPFMNLFPQTWSKHHEPAYVFFVLLLLGIDLWFTSL